MNKREIIYKDENFYVEETSGKRYYLKKIKDYDKENYYGNFAELINGKEGLDKYHKGDVKLWIKRVLAKDIRVSNTNAERIDKEMVEWLEVKRFAESKVNDY